MAAPPEQARKYHAHTVGDKVLRVTTEDRAWIRKNYPGLEIRSSGNREIIAGVFQFTAAYNQAENEYLINPVDTACPQMMVIQDQYDIRFSVHPNVRDGLPTVYETGGRIKTVAKERGLPDIDLHIYPDNSLCLVGALDEKATVALRDFLDRNVLQFFYDQSYFERYGRWPRGQYSHGVLGVFENYSDRRQRGGGARIDACLGQLRKSRHWPEIKNVLIRKEPVKGHWPCLCGSGNKFRGCHAQALEGILRLQNDLSQKKKSQPCLGSRWHPVE